MNKKLICIILILIFAFTGADFVLAESVRVPFSSYDEKRIFEWDFPYSDSFFQEPSGQFQPELVKASMGLAVSAFESNNMELQYETYLKGAGFQDIYSFGYNQETSRFTLAGVIASRKIGDFTLIAAVPRGQGYKKEWAGNLEVGDEERHVGFNRAAQIMEEEILSYIKEHKLEGKMKLWLTGFSRASAVSNLTAADMIESGLFEEVYAYLFAVPRTTKKPVAYEGIFNICGKSDPVTMIPPQSWGYERYGKDVFTPVMEMDSDYYLLAFGADEVSHALKNDGFWYNPEVSYQLQLIIEFMAEMFPTNAEYAEKFQDILLTIWEEANPDTFGLILTEAVTQLEDMNSRESYSSEVLIDYLQYVFSEHLQENPDQVLHGFWDKNQPVMDNVMREHMPYTYVNWIFSDNNIDSLYFGPDTARRIYFYGDPALEVYRNGKMVSGIDHNGSFLMPDPDDLEETDWLHDVFLSRNENQTLVSLPFDADYQIRLRNEGNTALMFYDLFVSPGQTFGEGDSITLIDPGPHEYLLDLPGNREAFSITTTSGESVNLTELPFEYSTVFLMAMESGSSSHIKAADVLGILMGAVLFILLLLFICLIIFIIHAVRKRKREKTYSPWFVIVPHLLLVILFVLLTRYFTVSMYTITISRIVFAALSMLVILLLSVRGFIRRRSIRNGVICGVILAAGLVNVFLYQKKDIASSSQVHFIVYSILIAVLSILAILTFYKGRKKA